MRADSYLGLAQTGGFWGRFYRAWDEGVRAYTLQADIVSSGMSGPLSGCVTRSGRVFSPFIQAKDVVPVYTDVDFSTLLSDAH